jgi:metallophosphoesterase superfamily enzyme
MTVVPGNHDRGLIGSRLRVVTGMEVGGWHVVHGDDERPAGRVVQGHEHPWLRWRPGVEGPCYLVRDDHLVLPAYSADAAGGNVRGSRRWAGHRACVIAGDEVLDFGELGRLG